MDLFDSIIFNCKSSFNSSINQSQSLQRDYSYEPRHHSDIKPSNHNKLHKNYSCTNIHPQKKRKNSLHNKPNDTTTKAIQYISTNIHLNDDPLQKTHLGSLYKLFTSDYFDIHLLIYYIDTKNSMGILDILVELMTAKYINQTFFYIPQLCNLIIDKEYSQSLENFLLDCCIGKIKFSMKVSWLMRNYITKASSGTKLKYERLRSKIEMILVNQRREKFNCPNINLLEHDTATIEEYQHHVNKGYQISYFDKNLKCFNDLKSMCESLKEVTDPLERLSLLRKTLTGLNNRIRSMYEISQEIKQAINTKTQHYYRGFILPFDDSNNINDEFNNLIVNFIYEYSICFRSKARVPARIVVECVRAYECGQWDKLHIESPKENKEEIDKDINAIESTLCDEKHYQFNPFNEKWSEIVQYIKEKSSFRKFQTYSVKAFIIKTNDDLSQEMMTMQLIKLFAQIFSQAKLPMKLTPYEILIISHRSGLIEFLPNTTSIDCIKKKILANMNLNVFFRNYFCDNFEEAQKNFVESLAAYSLITYVIDIKDRHNGNILLDMNGQVIHIDFGFILGQSPGSLHFENAPFKLTTEYIDLMDGVDSAMFVYFKTLLIRGIIEIRKHMSTFVKIIEITARTTKLPCFANRNISHMIKAFEDRFHISSSEAEIPTIVDNLIKYSMNNWRTSQYDHFQQITNNIKP